MALSSSAQQNPRRQQVKRSMTNTLNAALAALNRTNISASQQSSIARYAKTLQQLAGNPSAAAQKAIEQLERSYADIASAAQRIAQTPTDIADAEAAQAADMTRLKNAPIDDDLADDDESDEQTDAPKPNTPAALRAERQKEKENMAVAQNPKLRGQSSAARARDEEDEDDETDEDELMEEDDDDEFDDADEYDENDEESAAAPAGSRQLSEESEPPDDEDTDGAEAANEEEEGARQAELLRQRRQEQAEQEENEDDEETEDEEDQTDEMQEQQGKGGSGGGLEALLSRAAKAAPPGPWKVVLTVLARSPMLRGIVIGLIIIIIFGILMIGFILLLVILFTVLSPTLLLNFDTLKLLYSLFIG